jgi:opacity protein-like surface antigen
MRLVSVRLLALIVALAALGGCASSHSRKGLADGNRGSTQIDSGDVDAEQLASFDLPETTKSDIDYDSAPSVGGRPGMWFNDWSGVALGGSYFEAGDSGVTNNIASVTPMLMLRARLRRSDRTSDSHLQPYLGIGPGVFFPDQGVGFRPGIGSDADSTDISIGVDLRAGMRWHISDNVGVFGEYRLTHYKSGSNGNEAVSLSEPHIDSTRTTNRFFGGLSFTF